MADELDATAAATSPIGAPPAAPRGDESLPCPCTGCGGALASFGSTPTLVELDGGAVLVTDEAMVTIRGGALRLR